MARCNGLIKYPTFTFTFVVYLLHKIRTRATQFRLVSLLSVSVMLTRAFLKSQFRTAQGMSCMASAVREPTTGVCGLQFRSLAALIWLGAAKIPAL